MFPLRTFACAAVLTLLTSAGGLLTAASKAPGGGYAYNTRTVPLLSEALKLCISAALLRHESRRARRGAGEPPRVTRSARAAGLYLLPSLLYAALNNVNFATLLYVDPATFQVLGNLKILTTGVLLCLLLRRRLSVLQWMALFLLCSGTTTSQLRTSCDGGAASVLQHPAAGYALGLLSALLSALGAVYTEWLLKRTHDSLYWQNCQLYGWGVLVNGVSVLAGGGLKGGVGGLLRGYGPATWAVVGNLACSGLLVSWIMKHADSILKVYATSLAVLLSLLVSVRLFALRLSLQLVLGIATAISSIFLYYLPAHVLAYRPSDAPREKQHAERAGRPQGKGGGGGAADV